MPKIARGRISGFEGMDSHSASELTAWAERLEAQAKDPASPDDPRWLRRQADQLRKLAEAKERSLSHKVARAARGRSRD